jgi:hypothetical protein
MEWQMALSANWLQWPAMFITVVSTWMIGSKSETSRKIGFYASLAGNVLWIMWGLGTTAFAVIVLQILLAITNIRGALKAEEKGG